MGSGRVEEEQASLPLKHHSDVHIRNTITRVTLTANDPAPND